MGKGSKKSIFHPITSQKVQEQYIVIVNHIEALPNKSRASVNAFLDSADPWLIATAALTGEIVVTQEKLVASNSHKIKIPNICKDFNVQCINTFNMLKDLDAKFVPAINDVKIAATACFALVPTEGLFSSS